MDGLVLGIDLCDSYSQISCFSPNAEVPVPILLGEEESSCMIPTVLCKIRGREEWMIGAEGYRRALLGEGTMVDKLVKLLRKEGSATIEGVTYPALTLLTIYVRELLNLARSRFDTETISGVAFGLDRLDADLLDRLTEMCDSLALDRRQVRFLSHTECFAYYTVSQPKELWQNQVVAFDLTDRGLDFFEMRIVRGRKPQILEASREHLEEGFDLDLLETPMGERMADTILSVCADRMLQKKLITSVLLTGEGFTGVSWAPNFLKKLCNKRKVFQDPHLFADGAALVAMDALRAESVYPYICICEGRLSSTISVYAVQDGKNEQMVLAAAGSNWYEARAAAQFILDDTHTLEIQVTPFATQRVETISISLAEFPARPNKTTRIELILSFSAEDRVTVRVIDKGFGELFPASGISIRRDFLIS